MQKKKADLIFWLAIADDQSWPHASAYGTKGAEALN
jgi:hypothetical protein